MQIDWKNIDTVLLDMDGTLIDRKAEDKFWGEIVPEIYARKNRLSLDQAREDFLQKSRAKEHLPDWGNVSRWEMDLGVKLWSARRKVLSKAELHPYTVSFLKFLKKQEKKVYLVTASDPKDTKIKMTFTKITSYFDGVYTQPGLGASKFSLEFWEKLQKELSFDKQRTLLADDNMNVLKTAQSFGIKWLIFKTLHSSAKPPYAADKKLVSIRNFDDVLRIKA